MCPKLEVDQYTVTMECLECGYTTKNALDMSEHQDICGDPNLPMIAKIKISQPVDLVTCAFCGEKVHKTEAYHYKGEQYHFICMYIVEEAETISKNSEENNDTGNRDL